MRWLFMWYSCDFETDASHGTDYTYVWAWGILPITEPDKGVCGSCIDTFFAYLNKIAKPSDIFWFHNLKFDGYFILDFLIKKCNMKQHIMQKGVKQPKNTVQVTINEMGQYISITVITYSGTKIVFKNSLLKIPMSVAQIAKSLKLEVLKGSIDYTKERLEDAELSETDKEYLYNDTYIVGEGLRRLYFENGYNKSTIGADCLKEFKELTGAKRYSRMFPVLDIDKDRFIRKAYKGGYCYKQEGIKEVVNGSTFDYNSMYPSVMHSKSGYSYPYGEPVWFDGCYTKDTDYPLFVQRFVASFKLKDKHVPIVKLSGGVFRDNEYLKEGENIELTMCNVDFDMFIEHYDVVIHEWLGGYKFQERVGMFDKYINKWYEIKEVATIEKDLVKRQLAKLFLNNLYGKFATKREVVSKVINEDIQSDIVKFSSMESISDGVYLPVGVFCTAYARKELITAIQANYDVFCYCDTDSIHCSCAPDKVVGIRVHDTHLCCWKCELVWDTAKFLRQKTYMELSENETVLRCAGASDAVKKYITYDNFELGFVTPEPCKLIPKKVVGGVVLVPLPYQIRSF